MCDLKGMLTKKMKDNAIQFMEWAVEFIPCCFLLVGVGFKTCVNKYEVKGGS